jgi:7,8-dihydro-6-hydroxymethylpterin dimethyltransferase
MKQVQHAIQGADPAGFLPFTLPSKNTLSHMRERMQHTGQWSPEQMAGRRWTVACVSLEITQRCNLDCTLCYLSESAEAVRDFPLEEVFRRIDMIAEHYGPGTDVQVSGGEPTLRKREELLAIVERLTSKGLRPALLTNGIKATRELLTALTKVGLMDVAFHVDTTQQRAGYASETDLNALRMEYINRARGLPISVFFNTTIHAANFDDVPMLSAFFVANADVVRFASFQLQAETGRGVLGARTELIANESVARRLERGTATKLKFNVLQTGHHDCNRSAVMLVVNGRAFDAFEDAAFVQRFMRETANLQIDRGTPWRAVRSLLAAGLANPSLTVAALRWGAGLLWRMKGPLLRARGRVHKLTLFTHNFMDACHLQTDRVQACVFMAITQDGPLSMCAYNAQRDQYLLKPLTTSKGEWQPLAVDSTVVASFPIKWLKGRSREAALNARQTNQSSNQQVTLP